MSVLQIVVPFASQEREDHLRTQLKVLAKLPRDGKLLCGVGITIESSQWLLQQWNRFDNPFTADTSGKEKQGRELTRKKISLILDEAVQHAYVILQHVQICQGLKKSELLNKLLNICEDLIMATNGIKKISKSTYVADINFTEAMKVKIQNVEQEIQNIYGHLLVNNKSHAEKLFAMVQHNRSPKIPLEYPMEMHETNSSQHAPQCPADSQPLIIMPPLEYNSSDVANTVDIANAVNTSNVMHTSQESPRLEDSSISSSSSTNNNLEQQTQTSASLYIESTMVAQEGKKQILGPKRNKKNKTQMATDES